jgi:hypothetical protein
MKPRHIAAVVCACAAFAGIALQVGSKESRPGSRGTEAPERGTVASSDEAVSAPVAPPAVHAGMASSRPVTESQKAFEESRIPAVAALSIDRQGSPREYLASHAAPGRESRDAQLVALSARSRTWLASLRDRRAATTDFAERARLDTDIATLERNLAERGAVVARTVHDERRPFSERAR